MATLTPTLTEKINRFLPDLDNQQEEVIRELLDELGFQINDLPIACLPLNIMLLNYLDGEVNEEQLTPEGLVKYQAFHRKEPILDVEVNHEPILDVEVNHEPTPNIGIDVFDFKTYFDDFLIFTRYYSGLELYLRIAIWLSYKYEYIQSQEERNNLDDELHQNKKRKEYLDTMTDSFEPRDLVEKWYHHFNPIKIKPGFIDYVMNKPQYLAHPDCIFNQLYHKYVDQEWDIIAILWFSQRDDIPEATTNKITPRAITNKLTPKALTNKTTPKPINITTPNEKNYTLVALRKLTCPQLRDILRDEDAYKGCSKLNKEDLIAKILTI